VINLAVALSKLKECSHWVVGFSRPHIDFPLGTPAFQKIVLVLGAELEGLSEHTEKGPATGGKIPLVGQIESLMFLPLARYWAYATHPATRSSREGGMKGKKSSFSVAGTRM